MRWQISYGNVFLQVVNVIDKLVVKIYLVMPKFGSELMQEPRTERTEPSVQVQFSSVHGFWAVGSVLGSMIFKILRTGFEPVRTELSIHIFS